MSKERRDYIRQWEIVYNNWLFALLALWLLAALGYKFMGGY